MTHRILLHGCYHNRNFGDLLMADLLSEFLVSSHDAEVICPWLNPGVAEQMRCKAGTGLRSFISADAAVFGGGGYLHGEDRISQRRLLRYSIPAKLLRLRQIPYAIVGAGVGPDVSKVAARRIRAIANGSVGIAVRDSKSAAILQEIGVKNKRIAVTADLVMSLTRDSIPGTAKKLAHQQLAPWLNERRRPRIFGIHLSPAPSRKEAIARILTQVERELPSNESVLPVIIQDHGDHTEQLKKIARPIIPRCVILPPLGHWATVALLAELDGLLTTKLHVGIAAWAMQVPICGVSSHEKSSRFFEQIGRKQFQCMAGEDISSVTRWVRNFSESDSFFFHDCPDRRKSLILKSEANYELIKRWLPMHESLRKTTC